MNQQRLAAHGPMGVRVLRLPPPEAEVLPGVRWGAFETFFTPAFWATRVWLDEPVGHFTQFRLGATLEEEVAACLLGGHGIPAEVGLAAFQWLRSKGALSPPVVAGELEWLLSHPLAVRDRRVRYRFARRKARFIADSVNILASRKELPDGDLALRDVLLELPGIGPKTASWITRNWLNSDQVAIIDIHVFRACVAAGVFSSSSSPTSGYFTLEGRFLEFAAAIGSRPSILDNVIWQTMRKMGYLARTLRPFSDFR